MTLVLLTAFAVVAMPVAAGRIPPPEASPETVILLHGLGRGPASTRILGDRLEAEGYRTVAIGYPSTSEPPAALVRHLKQEVDACCAADSPLHFVGFSLGGLLVRAAYGEAPPEGIGRVVFVGPPHAGSELVDEFGGWKFFQWLGPTAAALGTGPDSFPNQLPAPQFPYGVIAGTRENPVGKHLIEGESDGTVALHSARLPGATDFITVERSHSFLLRSESVAAETAHFLRHGRFSEEANRP